MTQKQSFCFEHGARRLLGPDQATILKFAEKEYDMKGTCPGQIIVDLVEKAVSCDDEEALLCLERRLACMENTRHDYDDILTSEEFSHAVCPDDFREATTHAEKSAAVTERIRSTQEFVLQNMRSVRHKSSSKAKCMWCPRARRRANPKRRGDAWQWVCQTLLKDAFNGRWRGPMRTVSRSLGNRTSGHSVAEVLQIAWHWTEADGVSCPFPERDSWLL